MYEIIKTKFLKSNEAFTFNFSENTVTLEDLDRIFTHVKYKKCILLKGNQNIIIGNREHLLDNFSGCTGICIYK
jgi:hypothetical protein